MNVDKFLDILNYFICSILSISVFLIFVPFLTEPLGFIIPCVQVFVIFYLHGALNSKKSYYFFTSLFAASNIVFCALSYIVARNGMNAVKNSPQPNDIFNTVILQLIPTLLQYFFLYTLIVTAIVTIECAVSMIIKHKYFKNIQAPTENAEIESSETECTDI